MAGWTVVEENLGFALCEELKAYYSSYLFLSMSGKFGSADLYFQPISSQENLVGIISQQFKDGQNAFPNTQIFLIGNAIINNNDGYYIYYDNVTSKVFCYEMETQKQVLLAYSLIKIIGQMEALG